MGKGMRAVLTAAMMLGLGWLPSAGAAEPDAAQAPETPPEAKAAVARYMAGPSVFIQNLGQWDAPEILFALDGTGANVGLTERGPKFQLFRRVEGAAPEAPGAEKAMGDAPPPMEMHAFGLVFDGAAAATPVGRGLSDSTFNYTVGAPEKHREGVPAFNAVWYENLYPGVDLEMTGRRSGVKYNFHVAPGADWRAIRLRYENIQGLSLRADGALEIRVRDGWEALTDGAPYIYQEIGGAKRAVDGRFVLIDGHTYGFEITGAYDATLPLVIDPAVEWGTYLGGTDYDGGYRIAVDGSGNMYVMGITYSSDWANGGWDATIKYGPVTYSIGFVVKLSPAGAHLWSTYLGGTGNDRGYGIAVDGSGNCYATGTTGASDWVSGGWDTTLNGGMEEIEEIITDGYVVKLSPTGARLWSTYLGGTGYDYGHDIAVDGSGNCYATGVTKSSGWLSGGWDTTYGGNRDGYVVKLSPAGAHLWSTYLGGTGDDSGYGITVDGTGSYAIGETNSSGWVNGGWDTFHGGGRDGFVVKLSPAGAHLWSTYLGGTGDDWGYDIAVDGNENCYATGQTGSTGWVSSGWDVTQNGVNDAFVVKLNTSGAHLWSSYLGGTGDDWGNGIAVDGSGNCYTTGYTNSINWVGGGWDMILNGNSDGYVAKLSSAGEYQWSTYLGGAGDDRGNGVVVDGNENCYVTGATDSVGWVDGGWDTTPNGGSDAFVVKFADANQTGSLQVILSPAGAVSAGAQWRRVTTTAWLDSGAMETGIAAGLWLVEFKDVPGYAHLDAQTVSVTSGGTALETGVYAAVSVDMAWSTYLGGIGDEYGSGIAVDGSGNCYVTGTTGSAGWVGGGWDTTLNGNTDGYVVKLSSAGAHLWSTYLGGTDDDYGRGVAVDGSGNCYAMGYTYSSGWVDGGWDTTYGGNGDGYVVKLSPAGGRLWSTYIGGMSIEYGYGIAVDGSGNCHATGYTYSSSWLGGGWDTTLNGSTDAYVVKLSPAGAHLWSTYLGGAGKEIGYGIAVDGSGNVCAAGQTESNGWVDGGWDTILNGEADGYVVKLSPAGAHLWSTYLGGAGDDRGSGIAVDGSGNCYATGITDSSGWADGGWDTTLNGGNAGDDGFVVKLSPAGAHLWSTYLGGTGNETGYGIAVDGSGICHATGHTTSSGWLGGGWSITQKGNGDGYVVKLSPAGAHLWSTCLGGAGDDYGQGIAVDGAGSSVWVTGYTSSPDWVGGGWQSSHGGGNDAFVVKVSGANQIGSLQVTLSPAGAVSAGAQWRRVTTTAWLDSGDADTGIAAGLWEVEFKDVYGYAPPETQTVSVPAGGTAVGKGVYSAVSADMAWSTCLGGTGYDTGEGIAVDGSGNCYVTGTTYSANWVSGGWDTFHAGGADGYVVKLDSSGAHLWSTYLGGTGNETGYGIAVDGSGNCYATGYTTSPGWVSGGWDTTQNDDYDGYVVKLDSSGAHLWSTYLGGTGNDRGYGIAVDGSGNCYATGYTTSPGWVNGGWDTTQNDDYDGYVVKLDSSGAHLWSTYLGGTGNDWGYGIAVDGSGNCYATGHTTSPGWVGGGWDTTQNGGEDGYVVKLDSSGAHLWSTYLGGTGNDWGYGIAVDGSGDCYATGGADSPDWVSGGWDTTQNGTYDGYVVKLSPAGAHLWSTYLGGTGNDWGFGIAVYGSGDCYATGVTYSPGWVRGGWDTFHGGGWDGYVVNLSSAGAHLWSTYLGGTGSDVGRSIAVDGSGDCYATGETNSSGWIGGGWQASLGGNTNAFVVKISPIPLAITDEPADQTVTERLTATFTVVTMGGYMPLHYQWKKGGDNLPDSPDGPKLVISNVSFDDAGDYSVEVSDSHTASVESTTATLTVEPGASVAGGLGLAALALAAALGGMRTLRRR